MWALWTMKNLPSRLALECGFYGLDCQEVLSLRSQDCDAWKLKDDLRTKYAALCAHTFDRGDCLCFKEQ